MDATQRGLDGQQGFIQLRFHHLFRNTAHAASHIPPVAAALPAQVIRSNESV